MRFPDGLYGNVSTCFRKEEQGKTREKKRKQKEIRKASGGVGGGGGGGGVVSESPPFPFPFPFRGPWDPRTGRPLIVNTVHLALARKHKRERHPSPDPHVASERRRKDAICSLR